MQKALALKPERNSWQDVYQDIGGILNKSRLYMEENQSRNTTFYD